MFTPEILANEPFARFAVTDIDGVCRGKHLSGAKVASMLEGGGTIASAMFGWDIADELYDNVSFTGFHTGYPDVGLALDASTARQLPWDDNRFLILGELTKTDGSPLPICPRQVLKKVLRKADSLGLSAQVGMEFEWFVLKETELSVREKNYRNLETATQGLTNYSPFRIDGQHDFVRDLFNYLPAIDVPLEALRRGLALILQRDDLSVQAGAHAALGALYAKLPGRRAEGIAELREAIRLDPYDADSFSLLAAIHMSTSAWKKALAAADPTVNSGGAS